LANLESSYGGLFRGMFAKGREARRAKSAAGGVTEKAAPARRRLCSFKDGMAVLPRTLASKLGEDLLTGCSGLRIAEGELRIEGQSPRFTIEFERAGDRHQFGCDRIVMAAP